MPSTVGIAAIRISPESLSLRLLISCFIARVSPTIRRAQSSVRSPSGVNPWNRDPRCTSMTPRISSSCLRLVDMVGWVTPQASAARPKCRSFASASSSSSLSIKGMVPGSVVVKAVARWPEIARTGGHQYVKSGVRGLDFRGNSVLVSPHFLILSPYVVEDFLCPDERSDIREPTQHRPGCRCAHPGYRTFYRHCERSEAIHLSVHEVTMDCFASLAMTMKY